MNTPQTTDAERAALIERRSKDERVLIYSNLLNGVPVWKLMETFHKSDKEIMDVFRLVSRAVIHYCFKRKMPPVFCDGIAVAQKHKRTILPLLTKINLDKDSTKVTHNQLGAQDAGGVLCEMAIKG